VIVLLEQEVFVEEAFHTSISTTRTRSMQTLRKSKFGFLFPRRHGGSIRSFLTTNGPKEEDAGDNSNNSNNSNHRDDEIALTRFLQKAQDRALETFASSKEAPSWMSDTETLPFSCTGCGKCCRRTGSVYISPEEHVKAADYLNVTPDAFMQNYASHTLATAESVAEPWIRLQKHTTSESALDVDAGTNAQGTPAAPFTTASSSACIFLDRTTNQCQIYPVRPLQCRTYPFWPKVTASVQSWNAECRRLETMTTDSGNGNSDSDSDSVGSDTSNDAPGSSSSLPRWTPDLGGCEGMRLVAVEEPTPCAIGDDESAASTTASTATTTPYEQQDSQHLSKSVSVPRETALGLLYEYVVEERRFPHEAPEVPVE
jgi:Fe-S-cluster containining protein